VNIHFTDRALFKKLKNASLIKMEIGSKMYGLNDEFSDVDYLYVYATSRREMNSMVRSHHQMQFKEDGVDHNFVSLHTFLHNCINGDSTINFEVVNSEELIGTPLEFLYGNRSAFCNYSIIRSYLGLARRDIKYFYKATSDRDKIKQLMHIYRGFHYSKLIMDGNFCLTDVYLQEAARDLKKAVADGIDINIFLKKMVGMVDSARTALNIMYNSKTFYLPKYMEPEDSKRIDDNLSALIESSIFIQKQSEIEDFDMVLFYNAFENGVEYNQ
jgi:predicted nucleotidyltransferase